MSQATLEERVARLEERMDSLLQERQISAQSIKQPGRDQWMETVGTFRGDCVFKEMIDEAARLRQEERQRAGEEAERESR